MRITDSFILNHNIHTITKIMEPKEILSVRVKPETMKRIKNASLNKRVRVSELVRDILEEYFDRNWKKKLFKH